MTSLYQITENLAALDLLLQEVGGDVTETTQGEALEVWAKEYEWNLRDKIDSYGAFIKTMEADIEAIKEEGKRLSMRAQVIKNKIDRLKALAKMAMDLRGTRKLEGVKFTITIAKNGGVAPVELLVTDIEKFPDEFVRISKSVDSDKLREALEKQDAEALRLAKLGERGESVRVR